MEDANRVDADFAVVAIAIVVDADPAFTVSATGTVVAFVFANPHDPVALLAAKATTAATIGSPVAVGETGPSNARQTRSAIGVRGARARINRRTHSVAANRLVVAVAAWV